MATINQETENPSNAMERQVQTLTMIVERLTQRNQEFEQQLNQRNEQRPNDQHDKWDNEEQNDSRLQTRDQQERDDLEESNIANRQDQQEDTNHPIELESGAICMA